MKDIKISFPYPATSRHNLSQDIATSLNVGLVFPIRCVEVLPGDSHRISTSYSLISNPLVKPLLQGVRLRYARFWIPRRIYNSELRSNNTGYDPHTQGYRVGFIDNVVSPAFQDGNDRDSYYYTNSFAASSLFDRLGVSHIFSNLIVGDSLPELEPDEISLSNFAFNAEPYLCYMDICRNYFADSASNRIAFSIASDSNLSGLPNLHTYVTSLSSLDTYIDACQNTTPASSVQPFKFPSEAVMPGHFVGIGAEVMPNPSLPTGSTFDVKYFGATHWGFCVPLNRPDRLSRLYNTQPLVSQSAVISPGEISIGNLSMLSKLQRYLTRKFFGDNRFTGVMYSVFGQKVPHVDSPVCLDVFDVELGTELVASTTASDSQNPGVLGGYFASSGLLSPNGSSKSRRRYRFNEAGYIMDVAYVMPRLFRSSFMSDYFPITNVNKPLQGNFIPDFNGIGWQQPSISFGVRYIQSVSGSAKAVLGSPLGFACEPSWQQYRTLPDIVSGFLNPINGRPSRLVKGTSLYSETLGTLTTVDSPLFVFTDRMRGETCSYGSTAPVSSPLYLSRFLYSDFGPLNSIFGAVDAIHDNIFVVFRYSHQAKRQVTKRFTLSF
ncbi:major capsid protein [Microvirus mar48]|uniref:Major capsid protein n=1 Tax=Microvirus mar48 TaxID=2851183 RepID=A0A8F5RBV4_9VIRU|nr:major capsid protein [Microvirus mar48]